MDILNQIQKSSLFVISCIAGALSISTANAQLSVSYDPTTETTIRATIFDPFTRLGDIAISENILPSKNLSLPKDIPQYWDIISVSKDILQKECGNRLEILDLENIPHRELLTPSAIEKCGIGYAIEGTTLAYSTLHRYGTPPTQWGDLFDFNRYPGKRAFPRQARHLLEALLIGDGVKPEFVYSVLSTKEGRERALNKLDLIYDEIIWWGDINSLKSWLTEGLITMAIVPDGAILSQSGIDNFSVSRNAVIYQQRYYAISKSSSKKDLAYAFLSFATQPEQQIRYSNQQYYGPTIKQGWTLLQPEVKEYVTNYPQNIKHALLENYDFYAQHGQTLETEFNEWLAKKQSNIRRVEETEEVILPHVEFDESNFIGPIKPLFIGPIKPEPIKK